MSRPAVCRCASCEGLAPDDDDLDEDTVEARRARQDYLDDLADAHVDRMRDERDERDERGLR